MKRLTVSSLALLIGAAACSQNATMDVAVTKSDSVVASCQKLGDIGVGRGTSDADVNMALASEARSKGGNYVLVPSDGARTGVAYRCQAPSVATR